MEHLAEQPTMEPFGEDVTGLSVEEEQTCYEDMFIGPDCGEEEVTGLMGQELRDTCANGGKIVGGVTMDIRGSAEKVPVGTSVAGEIEGGLPCGDWPVCSDTEPLDRPRHGDGGAADGSVHIKQEPASEDFYGKGKASGGEYHNEWLGEVHKPADTVDTGRLTPKPCGRVLAGRCNGDLRIPGGIRVEGQVVTVSRAYLYSLSKRANARRPKRFMPVLLNHLSRNGLRATLDVHTQNYLCGVIRYLYMRACKSSFRIYRLSKKYCQFPCVWEKLDSTPDGDVRAAVEQLGEQLAAESSQLSVTDDFGHPLATAVRRSQRAPQPRQMWAPPPRLLRRRKNQQEQEPPQRPGVDPNNALGAIRHQGDQGESDRPDSPMRHARRLRTTTVAEAVGTVGTAGTETPTDTTLHFQQEKGSDNIAPMAPNAHPPTIKTEPPDDPAVDVPASVDESFYRSIKEENVAVTDVDVFRCSFCNDHVSLRRAELTLHVKCRHPEAIRKGLYNILDGEPAESAQRLYCDVCDAAFGSESTLIVHSWSHLQKSKPSGKKRKFAQTNYKDRRRQGIEGGP